jgi:Putative DNA-binding domain
MSDHLQRFFESISSEAELNAMVNEGREEDLHLEFKQKVDRRNGDLDNNDRKAFSKAVSGFANADGGVLVFGIETRKTNYGVDQAASLKPITNHRNFRSKLLDSILNTTQPVVDNIQIKIAVMSNATFRRVPSHLIEQLLGSTNIGVASQQVRTFAWSTTSSRMYSGAGCGRCSGCS